MPKRRDKRRGGLRGGDDGCARFADHVHAIVIARAVFAGRHKPLRFVRPQDEQIVFGAFGLGFVEPAQRVIVEKQFQKRVHITPLGLKLLRHGHENDFALVNRRKIERAFPGAKHLGHFRRQEVLQIIADGFADAAKLFGGLVEETVCEMVVQRRRGAVFQADLLKIFQFFFQQFAGWTAIQTRRATSRAGSIQRAIRARGRCASAPGF